MIQIIKSHNDYKVKPQVTRAHDFGCNMLEADIILNWGRVVMAHNKSILPWRHYGKLEKYLDKVVFVYGTKPVFVQIEFKDENRRLIKKLANILIKYRANRNIGFIILGNRTAEIANTAWDFYKLFENDYNVLYADYFYAINSVFSVDLYLEN